MTGLGKTTKRLELVDATLRSKVFSKRGFRGEAYDQSLRRDQQPRRHSLAPPEGRATRAIDILLPELPGCCDGPGVAITAPATPPPVPRRRHPSSYAPSTVSIPRDSLDDRGSNLTRRWRILSILLDFFVDRFRYSRLNRASIWSRVKILSSRW